MQPDFDGKTCVDRSIEIMRHFEPPEGYFLAFSGGKDSVVLLELAKMADVKFDAHYNMTTIDPPEVLTFMRKHYPEVKWERPPRNFYRLLEETHGLPVRLHRWCCAELKETGGAGRKVATGIRAAESVKRAKYGVVQPCLRGGNKVLINPMLHWTEAEVWKLIRERGLPYCSLYDEGWKRIGCICCPFEGRVKRARARWPKVFDRVLLAVQRYWESKPEGEWHKRWRSPEEVFEWWLSRKSPYPDRLEDQEADLFSGGME